MKNGFFPLRMILIIMVSSLHAAWDVEAYEKSNATQCKHALKELSKLEFSGTESVLDVGCGDGKISLYIAKKFIPEGRIDGLDNDESMLWFAELQSKPHAQNIDFIYADISQYVSPKKYDIVLSFWCLHWVEDYTAALTNIAQLLKQGGKALLCHIVEYYPLEKWIHEALSRETWLSYRPYYIQSLHQPSLELVLAAIRKSALTIEHAEIKKNREWVPLSLFKQNLLSLPLFDFISEDARELFLDEVIAGYISESPLNEQGDILMWLPVIVLMLKK